MVGMDHPLVKQLSRLESRAKLSLRTTWIIGIVTILVTILIQIPVIVMSFVFMGTIFITTIVQYRFKLLAAKYEPVYTFILVKTSKDIRVIARCERRLREISQHKWICPSCGKKFDDGVEFSLHNYDTHNDEVDKQWRGQKNKRIHSWPGSS